MKKGQFQLKAYGIFDQNICGSATFVEEVREGRKHNESSQIWLKFDFSSIDHHNSIEIILPNTRIHNLKEGKVYQFYNRSQNGSDVDRIYGFADIGSIDELPFFAERGTLIVKKIDGSDIIGEVNAEFKNASRGKIIFKGSFNANE